MLMTIHCICVLARTELAQIVVLPYASQASVELLGAVPKPDLVGPVFDRHRHASRDDVILKI